MVKLVVISDLSRTGSFKCEHGGILYTITW